MMSGRCLVDISMIISDMAVGLHDIRKANIAIRAVITLFGDCLVNDIIPNIFLCVEINTFIQH